MSYLRSKPHNFSRSTYGLAMAGVVLAGLVFFDVPLPRFISETVTRIATPLWSARNTLTARIDAQTANDASSDVARSEYDALVKELARLRRENYAAQAWARENEELKKLVGRATNHEGMIASSVILGTKYSPYDTFIIDTGANMGVRERMLVLSPEGVALGFVTHAHEHSATVSLFSASGVQTDVVLRGSSSAHALLEGFGGSMRLRMPRDIEVTLGTPLIVPGFSGAIIGTVAQVDMTPEDAFQTVYVAAPENIYMLRHVLVDASLVWAPPTETEGVEENMDEPSKP